MASDVRIQRQHAYSMWVVGDKADAPTKKIEVNVIHADDTGDTEDIYSIKIGYHSPMYMSAEELRALAAILPKVVAEMGRVGEEVP
jgi:hypothetical protein